MQTICRLKKHRDYSAHCHLAYLVCLEDAHDLVHLHALPDTCAQWVRSLLLKFLLIRYSNFEDS
jgi:hypothetical protein